MIIGCGLIVLSAVGGVFGHHDMDHSPEPPAHDGEINVGEAVQHIGQHTAESVAGAGLWLPFLSLRFWTYFIGAFGLIGCLLTWFKASAEPTTVIASAISGVVMGLAAAYSMRLLKTNEISDAAKASDMLGVEAKVTVGGREGQPGKVRMTIKGDIIDMLALREDGLELNPGDEVYVVGVEENRVKVVPRSGLLE